MSGITGTPSQLDTLSQANQKTIQYLYSLMQQEGQLFKSLQAMDKSPEEKLEIIKRINELSELRSGLHENLSDIYAYYQSNVGAARTTLGQQLFAMGLIENELDEVKRRLNDIQGKKQNKLRLVQLNTYYGRRYSAQKHMLMTIVFICVILFIIAFLRHRVGILPGSVANLLMGITIAFGLIYLTYSFIDFSNRDSMNFDEYNWRFDKSKAPAAADGAGDAKKENPWGNYGIVCIGSQCCEVEDDYDSEKNKCIPKSGPRPANKPDEGDNSLSSQVSEYILGDANIMARFDQKQPKPLESKKDAFSNYASF